MDERMTILPDVFPVGCMLESESAACKTEDGLQAFEEALSKQVSVASLIPPSWVAARRVVPITNRESDAESRIWCS